MASRIFASHSACVAPLFRQPGRSGTQAGQAPRPRLLVHRRATVRLVEEEQLALKGIAPGGPHPAVVIDDEPA